MGYIYKITNDINDKVYVGKTMTSIQQRWNDHVSCSKKDWLNEKRPLYNAMKKYGIDKFHIEKIAEYPNEELNDMEIYWIGYYNGYTEGYNATIGGDGVPQYDHQKIIEFLQQTHNRVQTVNEFGCSADLVSDIAHKNNITLISSQEQKRNKTKMAIAQFSKKDNSYIQTFDAISDAVDWCRINGFAAKGTSEGAISHISEAAKGKRRSAYGFYWKFVEK